MFVLLRRLLLFLSAATLSEQYSSVFGLPTLTTNKVVTALLLGLCMVKPLVEPGRVPRHPKNVWLIVFAAAGVPSFVMSGLLGAPPGLVFFRAITFYSLILYYFILIYAIEDRRDLSVFFWGLVLGTALVGASGALGLGRVDESVRWSRAGGFGGNPNLLAISCVIAFGVGFLLFTEPQRRLRGRIVLAGAMLMSLVGIMSTASRSGFLALLVMGSVWMVRFRRFDLLRYAIPGAAAVAAAFYFLAPPGYFDRILTARDEAEDLMAGHSDSHRVPGWIWGLKAFAWYPLTGVGRANFGNWVARYEPELSGHTPHNSFLEVASTMGLLGFVPFLALLYLTWRDFVQVRAYARRRPRDPPLRALAQRASYLEGVFLGWCVACQFGPMAFDRGPWICFVFGTVLLYSARARTVELSRDAPAPAPASDPVPTLAPGGLSHPVTR